MFKAIVADDDKLVREDICSMVDWRMFGFSPPKQCDDGASALTELQNEACTLVITDISMPVMNGVELIRAGREISPDTVFIVLSNYDDFEYVKEAMRLGAEDYLLKYQLEAEGLGKLLKSILEKTIRRNEDKAKQERAENFKNRQMREMIDYFWKDLYFERVAAETLIARGEALNLPLTGGMWVPVLLEAQAGILGEKMNELSSASEKTAERLPENGLVYHVRVSANRVFMAIRLMETSFLLMANYISEFMKDLLTRLQFPAFLCSGKICINFAELPNALHQINQELPRLVFYNGFSRCAMNPPVNASGPLFPFKLVDRITERLGSIDEEALLAGNSAVFEHIKELRLPVERVCDGWTDSLKNLTGMEESCFRKNLEILKSAQTLKEFAEQINEIMLHFNARQRLVGNTVRPEIARAVQHIYGNFGENISLGELAEISGMSRNYFSKIFKDETGINYSDFLNSVRIEEAKKLLRREGLRTNEVATRVGFEDYRYFCRLFKIQTGVTCSEYRKRRV